MVNSDILIVGAGPAGAITAYLLAKAGIVVHLLEKSSFPRRKTCGGGLTYRAYRELPFSIDPVIHQTVTWGIVGVNGRSYAPVLGEEPISYLIDRPSFDAFLLEKAIEKGAVCHFGQRCLSISRENDNIKVYTDDRVYQCRFLVGADGVHSTVARQLGLLPNRQVSLAHEARLVSQPENRTHLTDAITFDFGSLFSGYAWIFPKRDHLNVGVFRSWPGRRTSKKHLLRFINKHPALSHTAIKEMRAYPIPLGIRQERLHGLRTLLVGDAANLADPWLGEGLYYAISSGKIAAEEILNHLKGNTADLSGYSQKIHQRFSVQFAYARRLSILVNALPGLSVSLLQSSSSLQRMIIGLLRGEKTHKEIWRELPACLPKKILRKLRGLFR